MDEIDEKTVKCFIERANAVGRIDFPFTNKAEILKKLKLVSGDVLTNAADSLFGTGTTDLQMAVFAGIERLTFIDIKRESGNIFKLIDTAELYIKNIIKWRVKFGKMQREEISEIPIEAIREAIVNSFAHRDYRNNKGNEVAIFKDRIEIYNPGDFPEGYTPEDFIKGEERSILRNKLIAQILYFSKDIESWGSGIKRIYNICKENGVKVDFKILKSGFVVLFHRPVFEEDTVQEKPTSNDLQKDLDKNLEKDLEKFSKFQLTDSQLNILNGMIGNPKVTQKQLAAIVGINDKNIRNNIQVLKKRELVERIGPDKGGRCEVLIK
jgi:ATP-dependent DNA helicase RecG